MKAETLKYPGYAVLSPEFQGELLGVPGIWQTRDVAHTTAIGTFNRQKFTSHRRTKTIDGEKVIMVVEVRFDDDCKNGHNSFSITGHGWYDHYKSRDWDFGGCCHDMIAKVFPELAHLIQWHLFNSGGPMHYAANTIYLASNRDRNGRLKGEPNAWETKLKFDALPLTFTVSEELARALQEAKSTKHVPGVLDLVEVPYVKTPGGSDYQFGPHYTLGCYPVKEWYQAPYKSKSEALEWQTSLLTCDWDLVTIVTGYSEGKERDLDAARSCANWPDATDEQLMLPKDELEALLLERLPAMVAEFRADLKAAGFYWSPEELETNEKDMAAEEIGG